MKNSRYEKEGMCCLDDEEDEDPYSIPNEYGMGYVKQPKEERLVGMDERYIRIDVQAAEGRLSNEQRRNLLDII